MPFSAPRGPIVVGVGASAGGTEAVAELLASLPASFRAPVVISQHMPAGTSNETLQLARRGHARPVVLAEVDLRLRPGMSYLTPAGHDLYFDDADPWIRLRPRPVAANADDHPHPNVDIMLEEMSRVFGVRACAVVLSGMGNDGLRGATAVKTRGGLICVQDRSSSAVWGMPARIVEQGYADLEGPVPDLAHALTRLDALPWCVGA